MTRLRKILELVLSYVPTKLPVGMAAHDEWAKSIISMTSVPDNDSTRFALASMVMHLSPTSSKKAAQYFIRALDKGAANEVAHAVLMKLKDKQDAARKAEQESKAVTNGIGTANDRMEQVKEVRNS